MQKNGVTLDKLMFLGISALTSVGVLADKLEKDESVFTPTGIPGRDKNVAEAIFQTKVLPGIESAVVSNATPAIANIVKAVVPNVAGVAQPAVEAAITNEIIKAATPLASRADKAIRSLIK
jgi:hypothetical protein